MSAEVKNVVGERYGSWTITSQNPHKRGYVVLVSVKCVCGHVVHDRRYRNLYTGMSKSCGKKNCHYSRSTPTKNNKGKKYKKSSK